MITLHLIMPIVDIVAVLASFSILATLTARMMLVIVLVSCFSSIFGSYQVLPVTINNLM